MRDRIIDKQNNVLPSSLKFLPILGICGFSGSGKTTLIESLLPLLTVKGLRVVVIKHDAHGIQVDQQGKDSDRLFKAGADVLLQGPGECFFRCHDLGHSELIIAATKLARQYDLVLVEGHKKSAIPKIWLLKENEDVPPSDIPALIKILPWAGDRVSQLLAYLEEWLLKQCLRTPVYGCLLIGGQSRRMGQPKHLITINGMTWLERSIKQLEPLVDKVVLVGEGDIPEQLSVYTRLQDVPEVKGPLAGLLSAMRWAPDVSWLACACDMPKISTAALRWLLNHRAPGVWACMPDLKGQGHVEPLLAHYDLRSRELLEALLVRQRYAPSALVPHTKIISPKPPTKLIRAWNNVNTEAELQAINRS